MHDEQCLPFQARTRRKAVALMRHAGWRVYTYQALAGADPSAVLRLSCGPER